MSYRASYLGSLLYTMFRILKKSTREEYQMFKKTREGISARNRSTDDLSSEVIKQKLKNNFN